MYNSQSFPAGKGKGPVSGALGDQRRFLGVVIDLAFGIWRAILVAPKKIAAATPGVLFMMRSVSLLTCCS
jgi:hypothetical protein